MSVLLTTASMLAAANVFMTIAWYAHLKSLNSKPWYVAALLSWGVARSGICASRPSSITYGRAFASAAPRTSCFVG